MWTCFIMSTGKVIDSGGLVVWKTFAWKWDDWFFGLLHMRKFIWLPYYKYKHHPWVASIPWSLKMCPQTNTDLSASIWGTQATPWSSPFMCVELDVDMSNIALSIHMSWTKSHTRLLANKLQHKIMLNPVITLHASLNFCCKSCVVLPLGKHKSSPIRPLLCHLLTHKTFPPSN